MDKLFIYTTLGLMVAIVIVLISAIL